jgi:hypothetical protein
MTLESDVDRWLRETNHPRESAFLSLMFYRGAKIPGDFPHLEGDGPTARFLRFEDLADVRSKAKELRASVKARRRHMAPA